MKQLSFFILSMVFSMACSSTASGQKVMKLDSELKANSKQLEAKRKGFSSVGKYEFGPYKIVSGKAGWTVTKSDKKFFSFKTNSESKKKSSFVFVANGTDTLMVNTSTNTKFTETEIQNFSWLNQSVDNYMAAIASASDTTAWQLILVTGSGADVEGNFKAAGVLTDGVTRIRITEVRQWDDGKTPVMKAICGYEFFLDDRSIAAVQSSIDTFQKRYVWLHQDLDERMKSFLAAAAASLMVHTDDSMVE